MNKYEIAMDYKKELKKRISADYERRELLLIEGDGQVHLLHWHFLSQS